MDRMTYYYNKNNDRLRQITEGPAPIAANNYPDDLDGHGTPTLATSNWGNETADNYRYDDNGSLIHDNAQGISRIVWKDAQGKPSAIFKGANVNDDIRYEYDPAGKRLYKGVEGGNGNYVGNYYIRDASGNVISVYQNRNRRLKTPASLDEAGMDITPANQAAFLHKLLTTLTHEKVYQYFIAPIYGYDRTEYRDFWQPVTAESLAVALVRRLRNVKPVGSGTVVPNYYIDPDASDITGDTRTNSYGFRMFSLLVEQYLRDNPAIAESLVTAYTIAPRRAGSLRCTLDQKEVHLYGSSRQGIDQVNRKRLFRTPEISHKYIRNPFSGNMIIYRNLAITTVPETLAVPSAWDKSLGDTIGQKRYELSNHLGNVLAVISDKRIVKGCRQYEAELHQATDYYPFGSAMPGRSVELGNNPAAPSHRKNPDGSLRTGVDDSFKQGKHYAIDGKKTLYLFYPRPTTPPSPTEIRVYSLTCTTATSPVAVVEYNFGGPPTTDAVKYYAQFINETPNNATAVVGERLIGTVMYDVIAITFGPGLANVRYDKINFTAAPGAVAQLHIFVNPGTDDDDYRYGFNGKENDSETNSLAGLRRAHV
jgi:hypothetical protein